MRNSRLVNLLKCLNPTEINELEKYIYQNGSKNKKQILALYTDLTSFHPEYFHEKLQKSAVKERLFKQKGTPVRKLDDHIFNLSKILEDFLIRKRLEERETEKGLLFLQEIKQRKFQGNFEIELAKVKSLTQKEKINENSIYNDLIISLLEFNNEQKKYKDKELLKVIEGMMFNLDQFYFARKLRMEIDIINRRTQRKTEIHNIFLDQIIKHIKDGSKSNSKLVNGYLEVYRLFKEDRSSLKEGVAKPAVLLKQISSFDKPNQNLIIQWTNNYLVTKMLSGDKHAMKKMHDLNKLAFSKGLIIENGYIHETKLLNMVHIALHLKEYNWVKKFLEELKDKVRDYRTLNLVKAQYHFELKQYEKVFELLYNLQFTNINLNITARSLLAKSYYESGDLEILESHLYAYEMYLRRQKDISESFKRNNLDFILMLRKISRASVTKKKTELQKIKSELLKNSSISYHSWLSNISKILHT